MQDDLLDFLDDPEVDNTYGKWIKVEGTWAETMNQEYPPMNKPAQPDKYDSHKAVMTVNPFSLIPYQAQWEAFKAVISAMLTQAQAITVHDQDSAKNAVSLAATAKKKGKEIEASRKEIIAPYQEFVSAVNRLAKDCAGPLTDIETVLKKKINEFETRQRLELAKAQEAARIEAKRIQAEIDANALAAGVSAPVVVTPVLPDAPGPKRTEAGTASQRKEWVFEVTDAKAVPDEYKTVDERAIRDAVRRGIRTIPGVNIYEQTKTVIRA